MKKNYNAPTIETVELDVVDVIATSEIGIDTSSYDFKTQEAITYTNKGQAWQSNWSN